MSNREGYNRRVSEADIISICQVRTELGRSCRDCVYVAHCKPLKYKYGVERPGTLYDRIQHNIEKENENEES